MLSLEIRKRAGGAEVHRVHESAVTVGASSGNEVVVRARGVAGRHVRIFEKDGRYHLDLYKGVDAVSVNGRQFLGGPISPGDRIAIGEATITVLKVTRQSVRDTPAEEIPISEQAAPGAAAAPSEAEFRGLRLTACGLCRDVGSPQELATVLTDFLDREFPPSEWAVGELLPSVGFRPLSSTFHESPALPPRMLEDVRGGDRFVRAETVTGVLTLVVEPPAGDGTSLAILVREAPRLSSRTVLFLEELVQIGGVALRRGGSVMTPAAVRPSLPATAPPQSATAEPSEGEIVLRQTDDLKRIVETVEREVIDRAMRRVEGNQSRGAEVLNISRGSLIAKLKQYGIPDYRYLRRQRAGKGR